MSAQRATCLALMFLLSIAVGAAAQNTPPAQRGPGRGAATTPDIAERGIALELANALDRYAVVQARRMLQLNEEQYAQFAPRLRDLQQVRRRNNQARHRILQDLRRIAGVRATGEPDDNALRSRLAALREHDDQAAQELRAAYAALDEVLDSLQQARFRLLEETIEGRKLELLMRARSRAGRTGS